jgi:hypothetical protein
MTLKETITNQVLNRNLVIGVTAVKINDIGFRFIKGILLRAPGTVDPTPNTATIWIGSPSVTADMAVETGGFPLPPGASIFIPTEFLNGLHAISTQADQNLAWLGV